MRNAAQTLTVTMLLALAAGVAPPLAAQGEYSLGEVRSVDKDKRQVVMKAGEVKSIDMPPMTMPFHVREAKMLDQLQPGDKVKFRAINDAGKFTITEMLPAR
ncbi:copper-binding protein [Ramlibacter sp. AN1133]|uniref:copper-binding protein n=1 Tax=Ramlibacter sp. AN1133 TaxID=3133429 RepID=UPI0030C0B8DA